MGLNIYKDIEASKSGFNWLIEHQNSDGSWYAKYHDKSVIEKNKPTHFSPYIAVAALHFFKIFNDINFCNQSGHQLNQQLIFQLIFNKIMELFLGRLIVIMILKMIFAYRLFVNTKKYRMWYCFSKHN